MYKVVKRFRDINTGYIYSVGEIFPHNDPERINNLLERKLIEGVPDTPSTSCVADKNAYQLMTNKELEAELRKRGIDFKPRIKKADMIELLLNNDT